MIGRVITAILVIAAAAVVTMEKETAEVADMSAVLAESKYADAEARAARYEERAREAEVKVAELEAKSGLLAAQLVAIEREHRRSLVRHASVLEGVQVSPPAARSAFDKVIEENVDAQLRCLARADVDDPAAFGGRLRIRVVIDSAGHVHDVRGLAVQPALLDAEACLQAEMKTWRLPPRPGMLTAGVVTWRLPVDE